MFERSDNLPNFNSPAELEAYLGELPQPMSLNDVDFTEKARWMLEEWEAADDADKPIDPHLKWIFEQDNPNWEESYKRLMRNRLHDAGHITDAIALATVLLQMSRDERIEAMLELEQAIQQETLDYLDLVTMIVVSKRQQEVGVPGSLTETVEAILASEDRVTTVWPRYFPSHDNQIHKSDNNDPTSFTFIFKGKNNANDLIADFSYDIADGNMQITTWLGHAPYDPMGLTDTIEDTKIERLDQYEIDEFQQRLLVKQKDIYEWYAHYHGHIMNTQDEVAPLLDIDPNENGPDSLHEDLSIEVQRYHFSEFLTGSEKLYRLFK